MPDRMTRPLVLVLSLWVSSGFCVDGPPDRITPTNLCAELEAVIEGKWTSSDWCVTSTKIVVRKQGQERHPMFCIFYAPCQQDQARILQTFESWERPMAIVWAANGWTVVSDPDAWTSNDGIVEKVVALLVKHWPDSASWKTGRQIEAQRRKKK